MPEPDFVNEYMPATAELPVETVQDMRARLVSFEADAFPDVDTTPGSALGDLVTTPLAYILASVEEGVSRVESDLRLENVAAGNVNNCGFVKAYISNLGVDTSMELPSTGTLRLVFNANPGEEPGTGNYIIDRSAQFSLSGVIYSPYLPNHGPFICLGTSAQALPGTNSARLKESGQGASAVWFCDIPVTANAGAVDVPAGTQALVNITPRIPQLTAVTAIHDFKGGMVTATLPELAAKAQETIHAATLNTRNGAIRYVKAACPFAEAVYALKNGDRELLRDWRTSTGRTSFGVSTGCMDVHARTSSYEYTESQLVRLTYNQARDTFEGWWEYVGQPYHLESVTHDGYDSVQLDHTVISSNRRDLGALAAYSGAERLYLKVANITDTNGETVFDTFKMPGSDETFALFRVTYQTDPLLPALAQTIENPDYTPINSDIMVRGFIPVVISQFCVVYVRRKGVVPDLDTAADKIKIYLGGVGVPHSYTDAEISRIMGEAGVQYVKRVLVQARVQWTVADKVLDFSEPHVSDGTFADREAYLSAYYSAPWDETYTVSPDRVAIRDSDGLRIVYPNPNAPVTAGMMCACSPRNIRYFLLENALTFKEVLDA